MSIFVAGLLVLLPVTVATTVTTKLQDAFFEKPDDLPGRLVAASLDGAASAATMVLLVLIASRYFLARADRLKQPG